MTEPLSTGHIDPSCFTPGDIVEISTTRGLAYLQVTHLHSAYPEIVRALPGLHAHRPENLDLLVQLPTRFIVITPLAAGIRDHHLSGTLIGNWSIPNSDRAFPQFRTPIRTSDGEILYWWHWDGDTLRHTTAIDQSSELPIREVVHPEALLTRLIDAL